MKLQKKPRNQYFAMRHGQSKANVSGIVISDAITGCSSYGLSATGREQVKHSLQRPHGLDADTLIISSDFLRAKETAELAHEILQCKASLEFDTQLRERFFGDWNLDCDDKYPLVWAEDSKDAEHSLWNVESVVSVANRVVEMVEKTDQRFIDRKVVFVAHGDVLQILQTVFANQPLKSHRSLQHLETAEIRQLEFTPMS